MRSLTLLAPTVTVFAAVQATNIFVSSYDGHVYSLNLAEENGSYNLSVPYKDSSCGVDPSWLTLNSATGVLYCINEGITTPNGSITSYTIDIGGELDPHVQKVTISGPVNGVIYGNESEAIALAHYAGSSVSTWAIDDTNLTALQSFTFTMAQPGPDPSRQDAPHVHEAILDPSGQFILTPDLGADLVRVFRIDQANDDIQAVTPLKAAPGSGPRHAAFWSPSSGTSRRHGECEEESPLYLFLVSELANTVTSYQVTYTRNNELSFKQVAIINSLGGGKVPAGSAVAEIAVSPDNRFVVVSNRGDQSVQIPSPDSSVQGNIQSDSLVTFSPCVNGTLEFQGLSAAGGSFPRQFSLSPKGDLVAVGLQYSKYLVVLDRDVDTGKIGDVVAFQGDLGNVTCAVWA